MINGCGHRGDVFAKLSHHITACNPSRQPNDGVLIIGGKGECDIDKMLTKTAKVKLVVNGHGVLFVLGASNQYWSMLALADCKVSCHCW